MKNLIPSPRIAAALVAAFVSAQSIHAAPATWNNAAGGNWSVGSNWNPSGVPGTAADLTFGNTGAGSFNTNDITGSTNNSLIYDWSNGSQQTTVIPAGKTLTINGSGAAGTALLLEGSAAAAPAAGTLAPAAINGGGNLVLSGLGDFVVHLGQGTAGAHLATLDLSGLNSLTANIGRLLVGQANAGATVNRPSGILILAATNTITCAGASPQVMVQDSGSNANGTLESILTFGQVNFLNGDTMRLGGQKGNSRINFNAAFSTPSLKIRNADGVSPCAVVDFGYNGAANTGNSTVTTGDFSLGKVDISTALMHISQGNIGGTGGATTVLTLGAGTLAVGTLEIGYGNSTLAQGGTGVSLGTLNVNNSGLFASGALVQVSTVIDLGRNNGGNAVCTGNISINGGELDANAITVFSNTVNSVGNITLVSATPSSKLVLTNTAGSLSIPISSFNMQDASLTIPALNGGATMAVKTLSLGGSGNTINISSIPPIGSYPADFTLINYVGGYTAGNLTPVLGTLPSGGYSGSIVDTGGGVIKLHLTAGPVSTWECFGRAQRITTGT